MRNFLILVAVLAAGFYLYTHPDIWPGSAQSSTGLHPEAGSNGVAAPYALRAVTRDFAHAGVVTRIVSVVSGDRWRLEMKKSTAPKTIVVVCDGTHTVSNLPPFSPVPLEKLDPRPAMEQVFAAAAHISAIASRAPSTPTELCDGHTCWKSAESIGGSSVQFWVDTTTAYPVYVSGTVDGKSGDQQYERIPIDFTDPGTAEFFELNHTESIFGRFLSQ